MKQTTPSSFLPTICGSIALILWSFSALFTCYLRRIPPFQVLSTLFVLGFITTSIRISWQGKWKQMSQPPLIWIVGILCICGNNITYVLGFQFAPPEQVDLLNFLWPILVILFSGLLPKETFSFTSLLSALFGFLGVYILLFSKGNSLPFQFHYLFGYLFAVLSAVTWTIYTLFSRVQKGVPSNMVGLYSGVGFPVSLLMHLFFETTVLPNLTETMTLALMGIATYGTAFALWDHGVKEGRLALLSTLSYTIPLASISLLIIFGYCAPTPSLILSCLLICLSCTLQVFMPYLTHFIAQMTSIGILPKRQRTTLNSHFR